jgi:hypothetical protein
VVGGGDKMNVLDGLLGLFLLCEKDQLSVQLEYSNGKYIPGELINYDDPGAEPDPANVRQGPSGYTVEVSGYYNQDDDDNEKLYPTIKEAVQAGLSLYFSVIKEKR